MMDVASLLDYEDSPGFLRAEEDFPHAQEWRHVFRKARQKCGLRGVYVLRSQNDTASLIPVLYLCQANTEAEAQSIHKGVWNQGAVPFVLVQAPTHLRLYSGFRYKRLSPSGIEPNGILKSSIALHEVADDLPAFRAGAIDDGRLWQEWGDTITPETRVDWTLLENLKNLDRYVQECGVCQEVSHALIGKFVYFRYLRDRNILSDKKLAKWGIAPEAVFSRQATAACFLRLDELTREWLNGSIFPLDPDAVLSMASSLFQQVAGVFMGDTSEGQLHLDFEPYDFSFIPIETLSVIYEQFLHLPAAGQAMSRGREAGAYSTPVSLIAFMQKELERKRPLIRGTRILDPSCGSGAFLVQCYRQLIEKQFQQTERPLQPNALREMLTTQIFGVDRDGDACRVAELSLILTLLDYITPPDLENNPSFTLPSLRNTNIFEADWFDPDSVWTQAAATQKFDWIVGNPPWIELKSGSIRAEDRFVWQWMQDNAAEAPTGGHQVAEAFVWKTLPYLKSDGVAGLVLPAMTLFKKESTAFRQRFFARAQTWCVANFANFAYVLFAGRANRSALVLFFQPRYSDLEADRDESILTYAPLIVNQEANRPHKPGRTKPTWNITVDTSEMQEVSTPKAMTGDMLPWKLAMWGCFRDGKMLGKVARKFPAFRDFAETHGLVAHEGFQIRKESARSQGPLEAMPELAGKKRVDFTKLKGCGRIFAFPESAMDTILEKECYIRRRGGLTGLDVSRPPHIIVDAGRRFAVYSDVFIAVPAHQIGIASATGKKTLLKALSLYLSSDFVTYQQFFTTSQWGINASIATLDSLKNLPVPLDTLPETELVEWAALRDVLAEMSRSTLAPRLGVGSVTRADQKALADKIAELNDRVFYSLGLSETERILVQDFVTMNMQCIQGKVTKQTLASPSESMMQSYIERLREELDAFIGSESEPRHGISARYNSRYAMIAICLSQTGSPQPPTIRSVNEEISPGLAKMHQWMYFNRNLRLYSHDTIYCFKPMQALHWTQRQAILDAGEIIAETLAAEENESHA